MAFLAVTDRARRHACRHGLAILLGAAGLTALPSPALAAGCTDPTTHLAVACHGFTFTLTDGALVSAALGLTGAVVGVLPLFSFGGPPKQSELTSANSFLQIFWFTTGGVGLGLGALAVTLQASAADPCPSGSACRVSYGLGGASMAAGALLVGLGIYVRLTPPVRPRRAWLTPVPLLIPTDRGPVAGLGLAGLNL